MKKLTWWQKEINYFMNHMSIDPLERREQAGRTNVEWFIYKISLHKWNPSMKFGVFLRKVIMPWYHNKYVK